MKESRESRPPTYFNRKVGDQFTYRGVIHRVVAIHQKEREEPALLPFKISPILKA